MSYFTKFSCFIVFLFSIFLQVEANTQTLKGKRGLVVKSQFDKGFNLNKVLGVCVDSEGNVYLSRSPRQFVEEPSLIRSPYLKETDMAFLTVEQKRNWLIKNFSNKIANSQGVQDFNKDGKRDYKDTQIRSEQILRLIDKDKNGLFDSSTIYADGFNDIVTGVAHSINFINGDMYATIIPDVWRIKDKDGDGVAETKESIAHGFANHFGYGNHDLHSVIQGYDGKLYFSMGDRGLSVMTKEGKRVGNPHSGAILRCNPDGTEFEVFASGLRNCQYFDFDDYGNIFSIDHDADFQGEMERLVYLPEGSDSGWRLYYQYQGKTGLYKTKQKDPYNPWLDEKMWQPYHDGQPSHILPPIENSWNAPAAFSYQPGMALGGEYAGYFLLGGSGLIRAFKMIPNGANFKRQGDELIFQGLGQQVLTSTFANNGSLYFTLWNSRKSVLWTLSNPKQTQKHKELEQWLNNGTANLATDNLVKKLNHIDRRVRQLCQFELVKRKETKLLKAIALNDKSNLLPRIHALWGLGQLKIKDVEVFKQLSTSDESEIRAQTARWAGELKFNQGNYLSNLLQDKSPRVKAMTAIALGKIKQAGSLDSIVKFILNADPKDMVLRHAGIMGLTGIASKKELESFHLHSSKQLRTSAVIALRRKKAHAELLSFLNDKDKNVRTDTVRAIYDTLDSKSISRNPRILKNLASSLSVTENLSINIRALAANRRLGNEKAVKRLLTFFNNKQANKNMKQRILDTLLNWTTKTTIDPVDGRYFPLPAGSQKIIQKGLVNEIESLIQNKNSKISSKAINLALNVLPKSIIMEKGLKVLHDNKADTDLRISWLQTLKTVSPEEFKKPGLIALNSNQTQLRYEAAKELKKLKLLPEEVNKYIQTTIQSGQVQQVISLLDNSESSKLLLKKLLNELSSGKLSESVQYDVFEKAEIVSKHDPSLRKLVEQINIDKHAMLLNGGDPDQGKRLFLSDTRIQCSKCHALQAKGAQVGPSLQGIALRHQAGYFLESMLEPQAKITPGYGILSLTLHTGEFFSGTLMKEEKESLKLKLFDGSIKSFLFQDIKSKTKPVGPMPSMKGIIGNRDLRDIVAFLKTLKK